MSIQPAEYKFCVYKTHHPSGHFYIGKSRLDRIAAGYVGSGRRLHCSFLRSGFEARTWTTEILKTFQTEDEAYTYEGQLVTLDALCDPFCMNETPGGRGSFRGSAYALILKKQAKQRKAAKVMTLKEAMNLRDIKVTRRAKP